MDRKSININNICMLFATLSLLSGCGGGTRFGFGEGGFNIPGVPGLSGNPIVGSCIYRWDQAQLTYFAPNDPASDGNSDAADLALSYNVWSVQADGSNKKALTKNTIAGVTAFFPTFSPDGAYVYFNSTMGFSGLTNAPAEMTYNIWRTTADTGVATPVTQNVAFNHSDGAVMFSADGTNIMFSSMLNIAGDPLAANNATRNLWVKDVSGPSSTPQALTVSTQSNCESNGFEYSPDGTKILFASRMALDANPSSPCLTVFNVWVMKSDGSEKTPLTVNTTVRSQPAGFFDDGNRILFYSRQPVNGVTADSDNIWAMNVDGTNQVALTNQTQANFDSRVWRNGLNPIDQSRIVFQSRMATPAGHAGAAQPYNIWVMAVDGSGAAPLTQLVSTGATNLPRYSPDATKIVYLSTEQPAGVTPWIATQNLWIMDADGTNSKALTTNSYGHIIRIGTNDVMYLPKTCI